MIKLSSSLERRLSKLEVEQRHVNCVAHSLSDGNLLIGSNYAALFDCGMMFCYAGTIEKIKTALESRPLDYIFMTHMHYDHMGALPYLREAWPELQLVTSPLGAATLQKQTPRRVMRDMSTAVAENHAPNCTFEYTDDAFRAELVLSDGDVVSLGDLSVCVVETPGHTRDSLSFLIPELKLLFLSETPGVLLPDASIHPCYLSSYKDTISSIGKCKALDAVFISFPHLGIVKIDDINAHFDRAIAVNTECRDFILALHNDNVDESDMVDVFVARYATELILNLQPLDALTLNARATIACTLREFS